MIKKIINLGIKIDTHSKKTNEMCVLWCVVHLFSLEKWKSRNPKRKIHRLLPFKMMKKKVPDWLNSSLWSAPTVPHSPAAATTTTTTTTEESSPVHSPISPPQPPSPPIVVQDPPPKQIIEDSRSDDHHDHDVPPSAYDVSHHAQLLTEVVPL